MTVGNMARSEVMINRVMGGFGGMGGVGGIMGNLGPSSVGSISAQFPNLGINNNAGFGADFTTSPAVREEGRNLLESLRAITNDRQSPFNTLRANSTEASVATATVDNARTLRTMPPQSTRVEVSQTAQAQVNSGQALTASGRDVATGNFAFSIEQGGRTFDFNINVLASDTNESIQRRMAAAINQRNIGVTASVETTAASGGNPATSALNLTASNTGTNAAFSIVDRTGNLAATLGVDTTDQQARNAVFSLNGGPNRSSQTNEVFLAPGVNATLRDVGTTTITFNRDTDTAVRAATEFVASINSAMSINAPRGSGAERFVADLAQMNRTNSAALSRVGINVGNDGRLSINQDALQRAAGDGSLERLLGSSDSAFNVRAERIATNAARSNVYQNVQPNFGLNQGGNIFFPGQSWSMLNMLF